MIIAIYIGLNLIFAFFALLPIGVVSPDYPLNPSVTYQGPWLYIRFKNRLVVGNMRKRNDLPPFNYKRRIVASIIVANITFFVWLYLRPLFS